MKLSQHIIGIFCLSKTGLAASQPFNASFDTIQVVPDEALLNPIDIYQDISYANLFASLPGILGVDLTNVGPQSKPNTAVGGVSSATPSITVAYPGSPLRSLSLESFYYGCNLNVEQGAATKAVSCRLKVLGCKTGVPLPVASQTFSFTPQPVVNLQQPPKFGAFNAGFRQALDTVTFQLEDPTLKNFLLDNIVGTVRSR